MERNPLVPNLMVEDVLKTTHFYCDVLGFDFIVGVAKMDQGMTAPNIVQDLGEDQPLDWANVSANGAEFMFQSRQSLSSELALFFEMPISASQTIYLRRTNVDGLYEKLRDQVDVIQPPIDKFYGMREWYMRDCNGYVLCFGELAEDSPGSQPV